MSNTIFDIDNYTDIYQKDLLAADAEKEMFLEMKTSLKRMSGVLTQKEYSKVSALVSVMEEHGEITSKKP